MITGLHGVLDISGCGESWIYNVIQGVFNEQDLSLKFTFNGVMEGSRFHGSCSAQKGRVSYTGTGYFQYEGFQAYESSVTLFLHIDPTDHVVEINGSWIENGHMYSISGELSYP